ncbi:MAG: terminase family protein [Armatimonadota bacterium]
MSTPKMKLRLAKCLWGWEPHETQKLWLENGAKTKVAACGRRWGKTESAAVDAAAMAILQPGCVQIIVSPTYDQSRLIFSSVENLIMQSPATRNLAKVVKTPYPRLTIGGSVIMARTVDEDGRNLRGHNADRVIVDEAAYVRDSVVQEVIAPMLADRNGQLVMISTPFGKNHFYRAFIKGTGSSGSKRYASFTFPSWSNPHISREYIEQQRTELSARQFAVEYEARFLDDQSGVFPWNDIEAASRRSDNDRWDCIVAGIDWARYSDYTAVVAIGVNESRCGVIAIDRFNKIGWSSQIERVANFLSIHKVCAALTDQTSIGDPLLEQLRAKVWESGADVAVEGYSFTNQSKRNLVEHLAQRFSHGTLSIPRDEALMSELQYFEYELTQSGNIRMNARSGYHDDLVMALALACWQAKSVGTVDGGYLSGGGRVAVGGW